MIQRVAFCSSSKGQYEVLEGFQEGFKGAFDRMGMATEEIDPNRYETYAVTDTNPYLTNQDAYYTLTTSAQKKSRRPTPGTTAHKPYSIN